MQTAHVQMRVPLSAVSDVGRISILVARKLQQDWGLSECPVVAALECGPAELPEGLTLEDGETWADVEYTEVAPGGQVSR